jgi:hypothetical protein
MRMVDPAPGKSGTDHRILGLKVRQAAFLGSLAAMDCILLMAGVALVLSAPRTSASTATPAPQAADPSSLPPNDIPPRYVEPPGSTATVDDSSAATPTPFPSPTSLTEGWIRIGVEEVEILAPATYAGGDPHVDSKAIMEDLEAKGADYNFELLEEKMMTSSENTVLWAIDSRQGNPEVVTNVVILYDFPRTGESLAEYAARFVGSTFKDLLLVEQREMESPLYEIRQAILETREGQGTPMSFIIYAVLDRDVVWDVLCVTATDEFGGRLPQFDAIAGTFRAISPPA